MNADYNRLLKTPVADRRDLFLAAATRLGTTVQNIEKDFWVCWTLDALFNGLPEGGPRLLFKGGTSLSKGFGLIERFSEDIDITVFREDIKAPTTVQELEALSRKKRVHRLEEIRAACQSFIGGPLKEHLQGLADELRVPGGHLEVVPDNMDGDGQSLLLRYPAVFDDNGYVRPAVKIEAGAKSALDPHKPLTIRPYISGDLVAFDLSVAGVQTVDPVRTFWDKVLILHRLRHVHENRGSLPGGAHRVSRHYYDVDRVLRSEIGRRAVTDRGMAEDCVRHERMFFSRTGQDTAVTGMFAIMPPPSMANQLRLDFEAMSVMIFGEIPPFEDVMKSIEALESELNQ